jgi:carboxylesterase type B
MASWTKPFEAFAFGRTCAQNVTLQGFAAPSENEVAFLNVFAPAQQTRSLKRPVMVWIHGGDLLTVPATTMTLVSSFTRVR